MQKILLADASQDLLNALKNRLSYEGYEITTLSDGKECLEALKTGAFDFVLLDITLPSMNGYDIISEYRKQNGRCPIMILSARNETADKVSALRLGADDYMTKPFEFSELIARIEALLRRKAAETENVIQPEKLPAFSFGPYTVDFTTASLFKDDEMIRLSYLEYRLLEYFIIHKDRIITTDELLDKVWGYSADIAPSTIYTHISWLRKKFPCPDPGHEYIRTIRHIGYIFSA